jgi:hypothetical protein
LHLKETIRTFQHQCQQPTPAKGVESKYDSSAQHQECGAVKCNRKINSMNPEGNATENKYCGQVLDNLAKTFLVI